ncbi:MAG TPA: hypothetical protein VLA71_17660 [Algoriphagus sp.]|nr:hypothetical protein [Algoriphagus sp.]
MFNHFVKRSFMLILLLGGLGGCLSELDILPDNSKQEKLSCLVNGEPFAATSGKGLLAMDFIRAEMQQTENYFLLTVFGVNILDSGEALAVGFRLGGSNPESIQPGDTFTTWVAMEDMESNFEGAMGGVEKRKSPTSNETIYKAGSNHTGEMSLTVTTIDLAEKKISGTFRFTALDAEVDTLIEVSQGNFENVQWKDIDT